MPGDFLKVKESTARAIYLHTHTCGVRHGHGVLESAMTVTTEQGGQDHTVRHQAPPFRALNVKSGVDLLPSGA